MLGLFLCAQIADCLVIKNADIFMVNATKYSFILSLLSVIFPQSNFGPLSYPPLHPIPPRISITPFYLSATINGNHQTSSERTSSNNDKWTWLHECEVWPEGDRVTRKFPRTLPVFPTIPLLFHLLPKEQLLELWMKNHLFLNMKKKLKNSICGFHPLQFVWRF